VKKQLNVGIALLGLMVGPVWAWDGGANGKIALIFASINTSAYPGLWVGLQNSPELCGAGTPKNAYVEPTDANFQPRSAGCNPR
jgi:hypothetical protein